MVVNVILCVLWTAVLFACVQCTVDLNIHEIQYIADHLPEEECRQLSESLHSESYTLGRIGHGAEEPPLSCLELLVLWDQTEGKNKTFHHLTHRLRQLGEGDLANKISKTVYHEEADALKRLYLDDPFKKLIDKNSPLLDRGVKQRKKLPADEPGEDSFASIKQAFIITGAICMGILLLMVLRACCVGIMSVVAPVICPPSVIDTYHSTCSNVTNCCERCKSNTQKHLLGAGHKKGKRSSLPV